MSGRKKEISLETIEELAATLESKRAVQAHLGVNPNYLAMRCSRDEEFKAAFDRGWSRNPNKLRNPREKMDKSVTVETKTDSPLRSAVLPPPSDADIIETRVRQALRRKLFFCADIADYIEADRREVAAALRKMIAAGEVVADSECEPASYSFAVEGDAPKVEKAVPSVAPAAAILAALAETKFQSARHLCQNTGFDIDTVLTVAEFDEEVAFQQVGSTTVYYLKKNAPKGRLYNSGNHSYVEKIEEQKLCEPPLEVNVGNGSEKPKEDSDENRVETNPRFEHTVEHLKENGHSGDGFEQMKQSLAIGAKDAPALPVRERLPYNDPAFDYLPSFDNQIQFAEPRHHKEIALSDGSSVRIASDANFFALRSQERGLLLNLAELLEEYEETENGM